MMQKLMKTLTHLCRIKTVWTFSCAGGEVEIGLCSLRMGFNGGRSYAWGLPQRQGKLNIMTWHLMVQVSVSLNRAGWSSHTGKPRRIQTCKAREVGRQEKNGSTLAFKLKEAGSEAWRGRQPAEQAPVGTQIQVVRTRQEQQGRQVGKHVG
jgi:hypothetical protein